MKLSAVSLSSKPVQKRKVVGDKSGRTTEASCEIAIKRYDYCFKQYMIICIILFLNKMCILPEHTSFYIFFALNFICTFEIHYAVRGSVNILSMWNHFNFFEA